ncbi:hypothetical protein GOP47_0025359 [Adiantum capillus-veneris]|uniref:Uncharacterized protein n=1 Tax=Adiantum capillus-veneris TaxID=13818 RepID=A0A9D4U1C0_ADICA|nr:hypothetical protein GOP47_0025359 [Adiantum capillus-veneris]
MVGFKPSAPPLPTTVQEEVTSRPPVNSTPIYTMQSKRVYMDNAGILPYQNTGGVVYRTIIADGHEYPPKTTLYVFEGGDSFPISIRDNWDNKYEALSPDQLGHYRWQGRQVFREEDCVVPRVTARPGEKDYDVPTPTYPPPPTLAFTSLNVHTSGRPPVYEREQEGPHVELLRPIDPRASRADTRHYGTPAERFKISVTLA